MSYNSKNIVDKSTNIGKLIEEWYENVFGIQLNKIHSSRKPQYNIIFQFYP